MGIINVLFKEMKKSRQKRINRREKYWKLKQQDRIEFLMHMEYIDKKFPTTIYFLSVPLEFIKMFFVIYFLGLMTCIVIPETKEFLLNGLMILYPLFIKLVLFCFVMGFLIDLINKHYFEKNCKKLNKRFGID